ncbi:unnamed protein product [Symbiodinium sp. KB8]|nr:unnamed protein product [Symbiodinium sp. KB8]
MAVLEMASRVLLVAGMGALLPNLKGGSLTKPLFDSGACHDAIASGASCQVCETKFKHCKGHYVYEPFTVVLFEAMVTVALGVLATLVLMPNRQAVKQLLDWRSIKIVLPVGATYAIGDLMDLAAARNVSGTTLLVAAQLRLPLCALLRCVLLNRGQTWMQWQLLFVITLLCVGHVIHDLGDTMTAGVDRTWIAASPDGIPIALPLVLGKCLVSCCGAVHAEYFLQHKETKQVPLWITQVHFKTATIIGALTVALFMGNVCERILSDRWHNDIFSHLPNDVSAGDPRIPFFGGWDSNTWILAGCLILNNFLVADQMRNLTSIAKYVAYAIGLVLSYLVQLWEGRAFCAWQACSYGGLALAAVVPRQISSRMNIAVQRNNRRFARFFACF